MRNITASVLQAVGVGSLIIAGYWWTPAAGLAVAGLFVLGAGVLIDPTARR